MTTLPPAEQVVIAVEWPEIDHRNAGDFKRLVQSRLTHLATQPVRLIIDLGPVRFIGSSGIAVLIRARAVLQPWGGELVLRNVPAIVLRALDVLGLADRFTVEEPATETRPD